MSKVYCVDYDAGDGEDETKFFGSLEQARKFANEASADSVEQVEIVTPTKASMIACLNRLDFTDGEAPVTVWRRVRGKGKTAKPEAAPAGDDEI